MDELELVITEFCDAINKANDSVRRIMASFGVKTAEDFFLIKENEELRHKLLDAYSTAFEAEKLNILFGSISKMIH